MTVPEELFRFSQWFMIRIWCAKKQARHALRRSWMVLALSASMDLRAISTNDTRWHPVVQPVRLQGPEEKGRCSKLGDGYLLFFTYLIMLSYGFVDVGRVHPVWSIASIPGGVAKICIPCWDVSLPELWRAKRVAISQKLPPNEWWLFSIKVQSKFKRIPTGFRFQVMLPYSGYIMI